MTSKTDSLSLHSRWFASALGLSLVALATMPTALGQGTTCANAQPLAGTQDIAFVSFVDGKAFYQWTPGVAGDFYFEFQGSDPDSFVCWVRPGLGCSATNGTPIVGLGGAGGTHGSGTINVANANDTFLLEIRDTPLGQCELEIFAVCVPQPGDALEDNDSCTTARAIGDGLYSDLNVTGTDRDIYQLRVPPGSTLTCEMMNGLNVHSTYMALFYPSDMEACSGLSSLNFLAGSISGDLLQWTNLGTEVETVLLECAVFGVLPVHDCASYDLAVTGSIAPGPDVSTFCDPMDPHSEGISAQLSGSFGLAIGSGLHLEAMQGPVGQFGYFLVGSGFSDPGTPFGSGRLCLATEPGQTIGRYNFGNGPMQSLGRFDSAGIMQNLTGSSMSGSGFDVPIDVPNAGAVIQAGETWYFQVWFRDSNGGIGQTGFTNGLAATF